MNFTIALLAKLSSNLTTSSNPPFYYPTAEGPIIDPNLLFGMFFAQVVLGGLIGVGFLEKGLSMLEGRPYSGRRAGAYLLILFGLKHLSGFLHPLI